MNSTGLLRARVCLTTATTALFAGAACGHVFASQTHILKRGETVESLGRRYHLALKDILAVNHLNANDILLDGRSLFIPDAPHPTIVPQTMWKNARILGDRISIRIGPASAQQRVRLCDNGTRVVVTASRDGWLQVMLPGGHSGWVRSDFIHFAGAAGPAGLARNTPVPKRAPSVPIAPAVVADNKERSGARKAVAGRAARLARKHHEEHDPSTQAARLRAHRGETTELRGHGHHQNAARGRHERHLMESAAHHHAEEIAIARRHHDHLAEVAAARHHKHLAEIAAAHRHEHEHLARIAAARHHNHLAEIAAAQHHEHLAHIAAAQRHKHLVEIADAHHHGGHSAAAAQARHNERLKEIAAAQRRRHEEMLAHNRRQKRLDEVAAAQHRQHLQALAAAYHHHIIAIAEHKRHAQLAAAHRQETAGYTHKIRPEAESPSASNDVVRSAYAYRGTPYRWGASRPGGFDCSGFTKYVYGRKGVSLPRTAAEQFHAGSAVGHHSMKPGDLVFFHTTRRGISHVGMYVGSGKFVHSSSQKSGGVRVDNLDSGYYNSAFRGARRVRKEAPESSGE